MTHGVYTAVPFAASKLYEFLFAWSLEQGRHDGLVRAGYHLSFSVLQSAPGPAGWT